MGAGREQLSTTSAPVLTRDTTYFFHYWEQNGQIVREKYGGRGERCMWITQPVKKGSAFQGGKMADPGPKNYIQFDGQGVQRPN
jgi:hypothetical protein